MAQSPFLLVSRVGRQSLHEQWLTPATDRGFDVFLSSYGDPLPPPQQTGVHVEHRPGAKVAGYAAWLANHRDLWRQYDYVALFDDDLEADANGLTRLFAIAKAHQLKIAQPSLTLDSHFTYAALVQHRGFLLRYISFVEMMCPIFRTDVLEAILPLFAMGYESGIDIIWSNMARSSPTDLAVIDAVPIRHSRRVGQRKAANGFGADRRYEDDIAAILDHFDTPWTCAVPFGGVLADERTVSGRTPSLLAAASLLRAVPQQPQIKRRLRNLLTYWKHLGTGRADHRITHWPDGTQVTIS